MMLVIITGTSALVLEQSFIRKPVDFFFVLLGLFLTGGSANALNQYFERNIDAQMSRTKSRRPLPLQKIGDKEALFFAVFIGISGVLLFAVKYNALSAFLALFTIVFYGFFYTLWLKPNTSQNIVIGGIAGAMAPIIGWAASANTLFTFEPWLLFLIIFLWTPPHFWALALYLKEDYKKVNLPMLPIVKGDEFTIRQMYYYSILMVAVSLSLALFGSGALYLVIASALGGIFLMKLHALKTNRNAGLERGLFRYSIIYLLVVFMTIIIEGMFKAVQS